MTAFYTELDQQDVGYHPGSLRRAVTTARLRARRRSRMAYTPTQEAADLATLERIELQRQDYFDGMAEIHAHQLQRPR